MIRITGGKYRSRKLETPNTTLTKPTMDRVRAGVFNALGNDLSNKTVLDLFSGSGSYGFEALSRGALLVDFVDQTKFAMETVETNARLLKEEHFAFHLSDVLNYLSNCDKQYDLVTMDPPYALDIISDVLKALHEHQLLKKNAIILVESEKELTFNETDYQEIRHYHYGIAHVYLLRK